MIHHELFGQHLRLGNFLFKWAWSIAMKEKYGADTTYPDYYLWQYMEKMPIIGEYKQDVLVKPRCWEWTPEEQDLLEDFSDEFKSKNTSIALNFFFQSEKWFEDYKDQVYESLQFKPSAIESALDSIPDIDWRKTSIGLGVRLGDFVGHGDFYQIPHEWYIKALVSKCSNWKDCNVVVFSDDIELAKEIFANYNFYYAEANGTGLLYSEENFKFYHGDASQQFILGSLMDHWIIGNSTFSWWQAWLATYNTGGKVIHSGKVFSETGNMKHVDTSNYYPGNWIKCEI